MISLDQLVEADDYDTTGSTPGAGLEPQVDAHAIRVDDAVRKDFKRDLQVLALQARQVLHDLSRVGHVANVDGRLEQVNGRLAVLPPALDQVIVPGHFHRA